MSSAQQFVDLTMDSSEDDEHDRGRNIDQTTVASSDQQQPRHRQQQQHQQVQRDRADTSRNSNSNNNNNNNNNNENASQGQGQAQGGRRIYRLHDNRTQINHEEQDDWFRGSNYRHRHNHRAYSHSPRGNDGRDDVGRRNHDPRRQHGRWGYNHRSPPLPPPPPRRRSSSLPPYHNNRHRSPEGPRPLQLPPQLQQQREQQFQQEEPYHRDNYHPDHPLHPDNTARGQENENESSPRQQQQQQPRRRRRQRKSAITENLPSFVHLTITKGDTIDLCGSSSSSSSEDDEPQQQQPNPLNVAATNRNDNASSRSVEANNPSENRATAATTAAASSSTLNENNLNERNDKRNDGGDNDDEDDNNKKPAAIAQVARNRSDNDVRRNDSSQHNVAAATSSTKGGKEEKHQQQPQPPKKENGIKIKNDDDDHGKNAGVGKVNNNIPSTRTQKPSPPPSHRDTSSETTTTTNVVEAESTNAPSLTLQSNDSTSTTNRQHPKPGETSTSNRKTPQPPPLPSPPLNSNNKPPPSDRRNQNASQTSTKLPAHNHDRAVGTQDKNKLPQPGISKTNKTLDAKKKAGDAPLALPTSQRQMEAAHPTTTTTATINKDNSRLDKQGAAKSLVSNVEKSKNNVKPAVELPSKPVPALDKERAPQEQCVISTATQKTTANKVLAVSVAVPFSTTQENKRHRLPENNSVRVALPASIQAQIDKNQTTKGNKNNASQSIVPAKKSTTTNDSKKSGTMSPSTEATRNQPVERQSCSNPFCDSDSIDFFALDSDHSDFDNQSTDTGADASLETLRQSRSWLSLPESNDNVVLDRESDLGYQDDDDDDDESVATSVPSTGSSVQTEEKAPKSPLGSEVRLNLKTITATDVSSPSRTPLDDSIREDQSEIPKSASKNVKSTVQAATNQPTEQQTPLPREITTAPLEPIIPTRPTDPRKRIESPISTTEKPKDVTGTSRNRNQDGTGRHSEERRPRDPRLAIRDHPVPRNESHLARRPSDPRQTNNIHLSSLESPQPPPSVNESRRPSDPRLGKMGENAVNLPIAQNKPTDPRKKIVSSNQQHDVQQANKPTDPRKHMPDNTSVGQPARQQAPQPTAAAATQCDVYDAMKELKNLEEKMKNRRESQVRKSGLVPDNKRVSPSTPSTVPNEASQEEKKSSDEHVTPETSQENQNSSKRNLFEKNVESPVVAEDQNEHAKEQKIFLTNFEVPVWAKQLAWLLSDEPEDTIDWTRVENGATPALKSRLANKKAELESKGKELSLRGLEPRNGRRASIEALQNHYRKHCRVEQGLGYHEIVVRTRTTASTTSSAALTNNKEGGTSSMIGTRENRNQDPSHAATTLREVPLDREHESTDQSHSNAALARPSNDTEPTPTETQQRDKTFRILPAHSPYSMVQMSDLEEAKGFGDLFVESDANSAGSVDSLDLLDEEKKSDNAKQNRTKKRKRDTDGSNEGNPTLIDGNATTLDLNKNDTSPDEDEVALDADDNPNDLAVMLEANLLERRLYRPEWRFDRKGRPRRAIFAHSGYDDSLYYHFELTVRRSTIPKSGLGAFLKYVGACTLRNKTRKQWLADRRDEMEQSPSFLLEPLTALHPRGHGISVTLRGKNLDRNFRSGMCPVEALPKQAKLPGKNKTVSVYVVGQYLHYDHEEVCRMNSTDSFGVLKQHLVNDFIPTKGTTFSSRKEGCGLVKLGRYGPFRKEDRKNKALMDMKVWLFDQEPSGWSFGVAEQLHGQEQIIDITSDATGTTHKEAESQIPMYVNEVGHNKNLVHNVLSREGEDRNVDYYIDIANEMKPGEEVELLTNYDDTYEANRERKGYGLKNLKGLTRSDCDEASRLEREFSDRGDIEDLIGEMKLVRLFHLLEYLREHIFPVVDDLMRKYMSPGAADEGDGERECADTTGKDAPPSITRWQAIARRRLHWVGIVCARRIRKMQREIEENIAVTPKNSIPKTAANEMLTRALEIANSFSFVLKSDVISRRKPICNIRNALERELADEAMYLIRDSVPFLMNSNVWCSLSRNLVRTVCLHLSDLVTNGEVGVDHVLPLTIQFLSHAHSTAETIRRLCQSTEEPGRIDLSFTTATEGTLKVDVAGNQDVDLRQAYVQNSSCYKGAVSALIDHNDRIISPSTSRGRPVLELNVHENVLMAITGDNKDAIQAIPRPFKFFENGKCCINTVWYLLWQVVHPLYKIWEGWLCYSAVVEATDLARSFFSTLCKTIGVDEGLAQEMLRRDVAVNIPDLKTNFTPKKSLVSAVPPKKKKTSSSPSDNDKGNGPGGGGSGGGPDSGGGGNGGGGGSDGKPKTSRPGGKRLMWIFENLLWKTLAQLGWHRDWGSRRTDHYFLPPSVFRHAGFRVRVDYFDSVKQVIECCRSHPRWSKLDQVKKQLYLFDKCIYFYCNHKMPKGELDINWLVKQALATKPPLNANAAVTPKMWTTPAPNRPASSGNASSLISNGMARKRPHSMIDTGKEDSVPNVSVSVPAANHEHGTALRPGISAKPAGKGSSSGTGSGPPQKKQQIIPRIEAKPRLVTPAAASEKAPRTSNKEASKSTVEPSMLKPEATGGQKKPRIRISIPKSINGALGLRGPGKVDKPTPRTQLPPTANELSFKPPAKAQPNERQHASRQNSSHRVPLSKAAARPSTRQPTISRTANNAPTLFGAKQNIREESSRPSVLEMRTIPKKRKSGTGTTGEQSLVPLQNKPTKCM